MTLPAESQVGRRAGPPRSAGQMDGCSDRIRLTGQLREGPRPRRGPFYSVESSARMLNPNRGFASPFAVIDKERHRGQGEMCRQHAAEGRQAEQCRTMRYCPHCHLLIDRKVGQEWPPEPLRCPHCRLLVGAGRARPTPAADPGARGSAAGVFAHEAKRNGQGPRVVSTEEVRAGDLQGGRGAGRAPGAAADGGLPAARLRRRQPARAQRRVRRLRQLEARAPGRGRRLSGRRRRCALD